MNQLFIRSDKGEYLPGEFVCGAVYLDINAPTEGHGVQVSFQGEESVCCELQVNGLRTNVQAKQEYVDYCHTDLFTQNEPFACGSYCFPFRLRLPHQIPGTFKTTCIETSFAWSACVMYQLHANIAGAETMKVSQDIVVTAVTPENLRDNHLTRAHEIVFVPSRRLFGQKMHVTLKLIKNFLKTGENLRLRMIFTHGNQTAIHGFSMKLLQTLTLTVPSKSKIKEVPGVADKKVTVIREVAGMMPSGAYNVGNWHGVDNLMIPLKTEHGQNILPSVHGKFIKVHFDARMS
ncbi:hypothetical protein C0Q70_00072 [Pomacea canaliculata]|uniref:Arrestin-like N-terminal domain-containing protein n=1 Tax=Pomacea canaliculata TaxID=400727 RepID=A0A2T7PVN3_POMCA|nr:hypothetical protein C0Q70_00072 [Pomacea canaliculata]